MFHLNVQDNSDKTDVGYNTCMYAAYHKAVERHPANKIDEFDVILFQIY